MDEGRCSLDGQWNLCRADGCPEGHCKFAPEVSGVDCFKIGDIDEIPNAARMRWALKMSNAPPAITGIDVVVSDGRIMCMHRFLDGAEL